jgi:FlaA1/EpsC-like NDP-sugar epimerase
VKTKGVQKTITLILQATMIIGAFFCANILHYDANLPQGYAPVLKSLIIPLLLIKLTCFTFMGLLSGWWRYVSIHDLVSLVKANLVGSLFFFCYLKYTPDVTIHLPQSVLIIDGLLCFLIMSGARVAFRLFREYFNAASRVVHNGTEKILIVGAGAAGQSIAREIRQDPNQNRRVIGFVDQDIKRLKQRFEGIQVLATIDGLRELLKSQPVNLVILANPALCHKELRKIVMTCQSCGVKSKILPNIDEILSDGVSIRHARDVKLEDLLGRPPVHLDVGNIRSYLANKRVLVTGAAGSIGREICCQVAEFGAKSIILFDNAETPLFQAELDLKKEFSSVDFITLLRDAKNSRQVDSTFRQYCPDVVFHAAAYKHVPMSECNPLVTLENNVLGTRNLVNAADRFYVKHFVAISTDKAVNPTNIMGASKRAAELYVQSMARQSFTKFVTVRFGNVLGSNGSVVPIFNEQILNGGPVTVTDHRVTRFFMTIPEAVQLVMQAGSMGEGGEIFVLNMGAQIKIVHLAEELIRLSGMIPYKDIDIIFTGLRAGEKLHEELLHSSENVMKTDHEKICIARACWHDIDVLNHLMDELSTACQAIDRNHAIETICSIVPEFTPTASLPHRRPDRSPALPSNVLNFPLNVAKTV